MPLISYWKSFKKEFHSELSHLSDDDFKKAWENCANRTVLYEKKIIPGVAKSLGLKFLNEDFKIDYTLCHVIDGNNVPGIFIESENNASSAHHEIRKLCCLSAPLKVLIVCAEWSDKTGDWKHGGHKNKLIDRWTSQIKAHNKMWSSPAITGLIIAEWNHHLKFYSIAFDHLGEIADDHAIMFSKVIS